MDKNIFKLWMVGAILITTIIAFIPDETKTTLQKEYPVLQTESVTNSQETEDTTEKTEDVVVETTESVQVEDKTEETGDGYFSEFKEINDDSIPSIMNNAEITKVTINTHKDFFGNKSYDVYIVADPGNYHLSTSDSSVIEYLQIITDKVVVNAVENGSRAEGWAYAILNLVLVAGIICFALKMMGYGKNKTSSIQSRFEGLPSKGLMNYEPIKSPNVQLSSYIGAEDLKKQAMLYVDTLKNPKKYAKLGAVPAKGLLLYGDPGNGKTHLAKVIATEAGIPFFEVSGSSFANTYVGVGPQNVRNLFKTARENAPCVVFIDEFDAMAKTRKGEDNSERTNIVNEFLVQMDGMESSEGILVIAATNRPDSLDSAATRAGRFDASIGVSTPNKEERLQALKLYTEDVPLSEDVDLNQWAARTVGCSFAEIKTLINNAAIDAGSKDKNYVSYEELNDSFRVNVTKGGKHRLENEKTRRTTAWHEAGHALVAKLLTNDSVPLVTTIGTTSGAAGYIIHQSKNEDEFTTKGSLRNSVKIAYGGRIGEEMYFTELKNQGKLDTPIEDNITIGASGDIRTATKDIRTYIEKVGFNGDKGMLDYSSFDDPETQAMVRRESEKIAESCMVETRELLNKHKDTLKAIADVVFEKEEIDEEELDSIIFGHKTKNVVETEEIFEPGEAVAAV